MHIVVIGAGAIGSAIAASLSSARRDVTLVARGQRLKDILSHPLELERGGMVFHAAAAVSGWPALARPADLAFLCTKTGDLANALDHLAPRLASDATIVTLQNGVDAHEQAATRLPGTHVVAGRVHGFFEMNSSRVRHVGVPASILFGCTHGDARVAHAVVADALSDSGFVAEAASDIVRALWEKLLIAACAGGVAAALDIPAGQIIRHPAGRTMLDQAMREILMLAASRGIALDDTDVQRATDIIAQFPPNATTSLQRDLSAGRASEYDALVGAVLRMAHADAVPCPMFAAIGAAIRNRVDMPVSGHEAARRRPASSIGLDKRL